MKKNIIQWQYWRHPLGGGEEYQDGFEFDGDSDNQPQSPFEEAESERYDVAHQDKRPIRPCIPTMMGLMPANVYGNFTANFNFWVGHTNFDITKGVAAAIEKVPGVEMLDVMSRYRFRVGIGHVFDSSEVKSDIMDTFNARPPARNEENPFNTSLDKPTREKVSILQGQLKEKYPLWAVIVLPDGSVDCRYGNLEDTERFNNDLDLLRRTQAATAGVIFTHNDAGLRGRTE